MFGLLKASGAEPALILPVRVERLRLLATAEPPATCALRLKRVSQRSILSNLTFLDAWGKPMAELSDCRLRKADVLRGLVGNRLYADEPVPVPRRLPGDIAPFPADLPLLKQAQGAGEQRDDVIVLLNMMVDAYARRALSGFDPSGLAPEREPLWRWLEAGLRESGTPEGEGSLRPEELWRAVLGMAPGHLPEILAAGRSGLHMREGLRGAESARLVDELRKSLPQSDTKAMECLCAAVEGALGSMSVGSRARVLLAGLGPDESGRLLARVDGLRAETAIAVHDAAEELPPGCGTARAVVLDIGSAVEAEAGEAFDLVVVAGLSLQLNLALALEQVRGLLAPGGRFLAMEPGPSRIRDLAHGLDPDWGREAAEANAPLSCLHGAARWKNFLSQAGYATAGVLAEADGPFGFHVLCARRPADPQPVEALGVAAPRAERSVLIFSVQSEAALAEALCTELERQEVWASVKFLAATCSSRASWRRCFHRGSRTGRGGAGNGHAGRTRRGGRVAAVGRGLRPCAWAFGFFGPTQVVALHA